MRKKKLIALVLLICCLSGASAAQNSLDHLKSWAGKYPTQRRGKVTTSFLAAPEIRRPLLRLLSRKDFNLLTKEYKVEVPIKLMGNYLATKVCRPHACDTDNAGFVIDLSNGSVYVKMYGGGATRWLSSNGKHRELPREVLDYIDDFSAN